MTKTDINALLERVRVDVKPLEWEPGGGTHGIYADSGMGDLYFAYDDGEWSYASKHYQSGGHTLEAAKSAAQADFASRILSALIAKGADK